MYIAMHNVYHSHVSGQVNKTEIVTNYARLISATLHCANEGIMKRPFTGEFFLFVALIVLCFTMTYNLARRVAAHDERMARIEQGIDGQMARAVLDQQSRWSALINAPRPRSSRISIASGLNNSHPYTSVFDPANYAYAVLIAGCNPDEGGYRGYLYSVLVSTRILREEGAKADMVVMIQMSDKARVNQLPDQEVQWLESLQIKIEYIPQNDLESDSMYDAVMNKFRILSFTQYRRVLMMDGDVMPIGNLDYLFYMSDGENAVLKENVVVMGISEPANGGFYMLAPGEGEYEQLLEIVRAREVAAASLTTWPRFDEVHGWGHVIDVNDPWQARKEKGSTKWNFHFAFADQGLLYHWTKYVKRSVSILGQGTVENWASSTSGKVMLEAQFPFQAAYMPRFQSHALCVKYLCDIVHFTGRLKPWLGSPPADIGPDSGPRNDTKSVAKLLWWNTLYALDRDLQMNLNFTNWQAQDPPLGMYATFHQAEQRVAKRTLAKR
jgi:hypothetical protein